MTFGGFCQGGANLPTVFVGLLDIKFKEMR